MPLPLPTRYSLEVRVGNDEDIEEWLATDADLDRPVLIRMLGPESTMTRRAEFLEAVRGAAGTTHPNVAQVFAAIEINEGVYSISEWPGGIRLSDRTAADLTLDPRAATANAEGLARALAALHETGQSHGALDASSIFYGPGRPAKLGAFGRQRRPLSDVVALAGTIDQALTGRPAGSVPPSEVVDGVSPSFDRALSLAFNGESSASQFAEALASVPTPKSRSAGEPPVVTPWIRLVLTLLGVATVLILLGSSLRSEPASVPDGNSGTIPPLASSTTLAASEQQPTNPTLPAQVRLLSIVSIDPLGDGQEHPENNANLFDRNTATAWKTELYRDPLPLIKGGIGLVIEVSGTPSELIVHSDSIGTQFELYWAQANSSSLTDWNLVSREVIGDTPDNTALPRRTGGFWLIWLTDLPAVGDDFATSIAEIELR
jgi:serine/threonine protein kinase